MLVSKILGGHGPPGPPGVAGPEEEDINELKKSVIDLKSVIDVRFDDLKNDQAVFPFSAPKQTVLLKPEAKICKRGNRC